MPRKVRIAVVCLLAVLGTLALGLWSVYRAARQVRPFYQQALALQPEVLERGRRELESQATALYSDARNAGAWQALFTDEQINGWLATQLVEGRAGKLPEGVRDPRVAIGPDTLTLGFATSQGGVETVVSVEAAVFLTEEGTVAIHLKDVRAGALPLPILQVADELVTACHDLKLPVEWTQQDGQPIALVDVGNDISSGKRRLILDAIQLKQGELFVAGHTEMSAAAASVAEEAESDGQAEDIELSNYELRLAPGKELEIAQRPEAEEPPQVVPTER
jgi:hypothetical protein